MTIWAAVVEFLQILPALIQLYRNLDKATGGDVQGFVSKQNQAFSALNQAQTDQEVLDAAKSIQGLIRAL